MDTATYCSYTAGGTEWNLLLMEAGLGKRLDGKNSSALATMKPGILATPITSITCIYRITYYMAVPIL
ncbi:MAG: hypothetical protein Q9180_009205, partial [Flavoplaca navasiana]